MIPTRLSFASLLIAAVSAVALHCDHAPAAREGDHAMAPKRVLDAMLKMTKLDLARLKQAYDTP